MDVLRGIVHHISDQLPVMGIAHVPEPWLYNTRLQNFSAAVNTREGHNWDVAI